jgi:hypothetical protein
LVGQLRTRLEPSVVLTPVPCSRPLDGTGDADHPVAAPGRILFLNNLADALLTSSGAVDRADRQAKTEREVVGALAGARQEFVKRGGRLAMPRNLVVHTPSA